MFLKPANSDMENGFKINSKMSPEKFIYSVNWKLEKTLFERHQKNKAIWVNYLIKKKQFLFLFFISKRPA